MANETIYLIAHCTLSTDCEDLSFSIICVELYPVCGCMHGTWWDSVYTNICSTLHHSLFKPLKHGMHETAWQFYKSGIKNSSFKEVSPKAALYMLYYPLWCSLLYIIELHQVFSGLPKCMGNN